jgi:very-short-patch-repair endonuclease
MGCSLRSAAWLGRACSPRFARLRAPGPLNAGRGARARRARGRVQPRARSGSALAVGARARCRFESCERAHAPRSARFIADFLAPAQRLVLEIDGGYHGQRRRADSRRDAVLARGGYRVLRLDEALVVLNLEAAVTLVRGALGC